KHPPTPTIYTLSLHDALPISQAHDHRGVALPGPEATVKAKKIVIGVLLAVIGLPVLLVLVVVVSVAILDRTNGTIVSSGKPIQKDRKSTRLNSSHRTISYAVF